LHSLPSFKKAVCKNLASTVLWTLQKEDKTLQIEGRAYNDGVALRLVLPCEGEAEIISEATGFALAIHAK